MFFLKAASNEITETVTEEATSPEPDEVTDTLSTELDSVKSEDETIPDDGATDTSAENAGTPPGEPFE